MLLYNELLAVDDVETGWQTLGGCCATAKELTADAVDIEWLAVGIATDSVDSIDDAAGDGELTVGEVEEVVLSLTAAENNLILAGR